MVNFALVTPAHIAVAMAADTPKEAIGGLCLVASIDPAFATDTTDTVWRATSLSVRHGLLMEWLAAEIIEAGGL